MSDSNTPSEILINIKGPSELKLQISITTDKTVLELKQAIAEKSDVEADRQRLIYSGRVLKDEDLLSIYKIQSSHTIHMVKGVSRSAASSTQAAPPQQLPTMQAGQIPTDPLTVLNGPMGHGVMAGFNPFADLGLNTNDPNMFQGMMDNPQFLQQMSSMMSNPAVLDQILASNPQLQAIGPQMRQIFQSEHFRNMISNPQALRSMLQMSSMMNGQSGGGGGFPGMFGAGAGGAGGFPAPGLPSYATNNNGSSTTPQQQQTPGAGAGAGAGGVGQLPFFNPFMFGIPSNPLSSPGASTASAPTISSSSTNTNPDVTSPSAPASQQTQSSTTQPQSPSAPSQQQPQLNATPNATANPNANPFAALSSLLGGAAANPYGTMDPAMMQSLFGGMGGNPFGNNVPNAGFGGFGMGGGTPGGAGGDTRSPEERYESQLRQLQEMGFTNPVQNVRALMATAGNVNAAIEYILSGHGM